MRFIQVKPGMNINVDHIESVLDDGKGGSTIYTHHDNYPTFMPPQLILSLLEEEEKKPDGLTGMLENFGTFAG